MRDGRAIVYDNKYGPCDLRRLARLERRLGWELASDYRQFLIQHNGGRPRDRFYSIGPESADLHHVYGLHSGPEFQQLDRMWRFHRKSLASIFGRRAALPIGDDSVGDLLILHRDGSVWFVDRLRDGGGTRLADTFGEFRRGLRAFDDEPSEVERALYYDDVSALREVLASVAIDWRDEHGRTLLERAAISASREIIEELHRRRATLGSAPELARMNAEIFEKHAEIVTLLEALYSDRI